MYCINCGKSIDDDSKICPYCGNKTDSNYDAFNDISGERGTWNNERNVTYSTNYFSILAIIFSIMGSMVAIPFIVLGFIRASKMNGKGRALCIISCIIQVFWLVMAIIMMPYYMEIVESYLNEINDLKGYIMNYMSM